MVTRSYGCPNSCQCTIACGRGSQSGVFFVLKVAVFVFGIEFVETD